MQPLFLKAIEYAQEAVELDAGSSEAYLQLAHTLGRYAQTLGTMTALSEGYAEQIRTAIDKAIDLDPRNYQAYLSLGAWHSEIIFAGFMAWLLYGADEDDSLDAYAKALEIAPKDNNVHYQYAVGLLKLDDRNIEQALHHLNIAVELPVADAYQKIVQEKVKEMLIEPGTSWVVPINLHYSRRNLSVDSVFSLLPSSGAKGLHLHSECHKLAALQMGLFGFGL